MANKSYNRRSRRRRTNKKNKPTKLKSKKKSYKKGGMLKSGNSASEASEAQTPGAQAQYLKAFVDACRSGEEDGQAEKTSKILAGLKDPGCDKRIIERQRFPKLFDEALKVGEIVELIPPEDEPGIRWFGEVDSKTATGVYVRWYKVGLLEYDRQFPALDFNEFHLIKGKVDL